MVTRDAATHIDLPDLIRLQADARALKLPSARPSRARHSGLQRSPQKGRGMAFAEVRQYQPGDDIRSIDWRVTARRQSPHTKLYEEERERPVLLLCDLSASLFFASTGAYKQVRCAQVASILAWLALWAGDQVGGIVFNGEHMAVLRPARRKKSVLRLLDALAEQQHKPGEDIQAAIDPTASRNALDQALQEARRVAHTGSRIFVISDFLQLTDETASLLGALARHNQVSALRIVDPLEQTLPEQGRFAIAGPDGPVWFNAGNPRFQAAWREKVEAHETALSACFQKSGVLSATLMTGDDPATALKPLLGPRGRIG
ncbi:hypothetical protein MSNKSG1_08153 [Marinobacter santoriniensis NKSG1]|uniref:DUF58 domain-containing protein n=1 Tax=Marinobacter santoriniensis NKSG1 TaxID=1288826 RepID=M7D528_9GAMM|nr:DUF58 domain-containing protein [Marinobacter santoriniensis]EMP55828.1 hypothetical protein MSNKSG1_08153 [Marinobacter santoriniensis NKSG1]